MHKTQRITLINDFVDFVKKNNIANFIRNSKDNEVLFFGNQLIQLIEKFPELEKSKKFDMITKELIGYKEEKDEIEISSDVMKKIAELEEKVSILEKTKTISQSINSTKIGDINLNLESDNTFQNDEYAILSGIEFLITNNNVKKALSLIKWRKNILEISNNSGPLIAKIVARNTLKTLEIKETDVIDANLTFMEQFFSIHQNLSQKNENKENLVELYEKQLIESVNNLLLNKN